MQVKATVLRGGNPAEWLREIAVWKLSPGEYSCFLLPESVRDRTVSGLFVIFKDSSKAELLPLLDPYGCVAGKLYIPCHAKLVPQVAESEWESLLLWDHQVYHPVAGLVGFEEKDQINFSELFAYTTPLVSDWSYAHPGNPPSQLLQAITVVPPTAENLLNEIKETIGQKPLQDIPKKKEDQRNAVQKITDRIQLGFFRGVADIFENMARKALEKGVTDGDDSYYSTDGKKGLLTKFFHWVYKNLEELEARRKNEIERLIRLFDEDPDEALRYALPLDSPYMNRGNSSNPADRLLRKQPLFDLSKLGGGQGVDAWDIGDRFDSLRTKYVKAATLAIEEKDYKKAAYIYAHLLGDYAAAANVLEQGGLYREAAILHKDHLNNPAAAASCLENGGLVLEAISLYKEMQQFEKAGDLYMRLGQQEEGSILYHKITDDYLNKRDYKEAARIVHDKLKQDERAREILLTGWNQSYQHEYCLKRYFEILDQEKEEEWENQLRQIYLTHTPDTHMVSLLNVMEQLKKKKQEGNFSDTADDIAYEIVHREAEKGNKYTLQRLNHFIKNDKLLSSDTSRYVNNAKNGPLRVSSKGSFLLDTTIQWKKGIWHRHQFFAVGLKNSRMHFARGNWYGNLEYYTWEQILPEHTWFTFFQSPYYSKQIILHVSGNVAPIAKRLLPKNRYFPESNHIFCPQWLKDRISLCAMTEKQEICQITIINNSGTLHYYSMEGELLRSLHCTGVDKEVQLAAFSNHAKLITKNDFFYSAANNLIMAMSADGKVNTMEMDTLTRFFAASDYFLTLYLVISTNKGCLLCKPDGLYLNPGDIFFASDLIPDIIEFISAGHFVMAQKKRLYLFRISDGIPEQIKEYETHTRVIAIFPGSERDRFSVLEERGQVSWFEIGDS